MTDRASVAVGGGVDGWFAWRRGAALAVLGRRADVPHVHPHRFRHDTARRLVENVDLPTVAAPLGHSRLATVRVYPAQAALERAAEILGRT